MIGVAKTANISEPVHVEPVQADGHGQEQNGSDATNKLLLHPFDCTGSTARAQPQGLNRTGSTMNKNGSPATNKLHH